MVKHKLLQWVTKKKSSSSSKLKLQSATMIWKKAVFNSNRLSKIFRTKLISNSKAKQWWTGWFKKSYNSKSTPTKSVKDCRYHRRKTSHSGTRYWILMTIIRNWRSKWNNYRLPYSRMTNLSSNVINWNKNWRLKRRNMDSRSEITKKANGALAIFREPWHKCKKSTNMNSLFNTLKAKGWSRHSRRFKNILRAKSQSWRSSLILKVSFMKKISI